MQRLAKCSWRIRNVQQKTAQLIAPNSTKNYNVSNYHTINQNDWKKYSTFNKSQPIEHMMQSLRTYQVLNKMRPNETMSYIETQQSLIKNIINLFAKNATLRQQQQNLNQETKEIHEEDESKDQNNDKDGKKTKKTSFMKKLAKLIRNLLLFPIVLYTIAWIISKSLYFVKEREHITGIWTILNHIHTVGQQIERLMGTSGRFAYIAAKFFLTYQYYKKFDKWDEHSSAVHEKTAASIMKLILHYGGVYVKAGQEMSMMHGLLPDEYIDAFRPLQDKVRKLPVEDMKKLILHEFGGKEWEELFSHFEEEPIAAASLAQVHRARRADNGTVVAVKVQYPDVGHFYTGDLFVQGVTTKVLDYFNGTNMSETQDKLKEELANELNFEHELKNGTTAAENFGFIDNDKEDFYIPRFYRDLTTPRVLTMEYIKGCKVNDLKSIEEMGFSTSDVAQILFTRMSTMAFDHGFLHADPHPGNVFVRPRPDAPHLPQLVLLDHGLYGKLPQDIKMAYRKFWKAIIVKDTEAVEEACKTFGVTDIEMFSSLFMMQSYTEAMDDASAFAKENRGKMDPGDMDHDRMNDVFNHLRPEMMLVMRSNFILGAVNIELGCPLSRFRLVANVAYQKDYEDKSLSTWSERYAAAKEYYGFQWQLFKLAVVTKALSIAIKFYSFFIGDPKDLFMKKKQKNDGTPNPIHSVPTPPNNNTAEKL